MFRLGQSSIGEVEEIVVPQFRIRLAYEYVGNDIKFLVGPVLSSGRSSMESPNLSMKGWIFLLCICVRARFVEVTIVSNQRRVSDC